MAGKRHHILPRFLLRGFASRVDGEKVFTWVYRKGGERFETTVENVGVEKHFYGKQTEISADDVITNLEGGYATLVKDLRDQPDGAEMRHAEISEFVTHLIIRTKQLREFFRDSADYLLDELTTYLADPSNLKRLLLSKPELIQAELEKCLQQLQVPEIYKGALIELVKLNASTLVDQHMSDLQSGLTELISDIRTLLPKAVKDGHIKSLARDPAPDTRSEGYRFLRWFIREAHHSLILGDIGCLFEIDGRRRFRPFDDMGETIVNIYLPLSSQKLLVGTSFSDASHVDFAAINKATAKCSYEYFVCSELLPTNDRLPSFIGDWAGILTQREMERLLTEIIDDLERDPFGR
jgi:hypothetical protein